MVRALRHALKIERREGELKQLLAVNNEPALVDLVALPSVLKPEDLLREHGNLVPAKSSPLAAVLERGAPGDIAEVRSGTARVQDQGSQLMAIALVEQSPVNEGEEWLDMCAGPGGKAALLASYAELNGADLLCNESQAHRAKLVERAIAPVSSRSATQTADGRQIGAQMPERFDRVLLDAPCSGLGALRRRPEARWRKSPRDLNDLVTLQRELLASAEKALKPGGLLAYVTCSPHPSETVAQVDWVQKNLPSLELVPVTSEYLPTAAGRMTVQLWPHLNGTDGMFLAMFQKKATGE
jgi:16S rRNA (cytosine967-C5)-methyltransferase